VDVVAVHTAWADRGIDLGSADVDSLEAPRVAVLSDAPTDETAFGAIWFLLEQRLGQPFTALRVGDLGSADLTRYNVLVMPDGPTGRYQAALGEETVKRLTAWVRDGGVLVLSGGAAVMAADKKVGWTKARLLGPEEEKEEKPGEKDEAAAKARAAADKDVLETERDLRRQMERRQQETEFTPGAIFAAELEPRHFLRYGYGDGPLPVFIASSHVFAASPTGANVARIRKEKPLLSGFAWPEAEARLRGAAYLIDEPLGRGHVVLFADDPNFRNYWRGLEKLFTNALLLAPSLD
jgi:hypothetical protein